MLLSLVFHNHQPVGQLPWVYEDAWRNSYAPFLSVLEKHPRVRVALHYTGSLLDWLEKQQPETLQLARKLAQRGQVEILAGGYYEPILSIWPPADQESQINRLRDKVESLFGVAPRGLWLAERVWEPQLAEVFSRCGIGYSFVDSSVFATTGKTESETFGVYQTANAPLRIFPINQELRYHIPWREPEKTIEYLKTIHQSAPNALAVFADDGEKFGAWPGTFDMIFTDGWLDKFFTTLEENASWLQTVTPGEYSRTHQSLGAIDLPAGSYSEMQDWSRGNWRNFLQRYTESRDMRDEVLRAAKKVREATNHPELQQALQHILRAQANDAYWHGVFGGLYLRHLRQAIYAEATQAATLIDGSQPFVRANKTDAETFIENESQKIGVRPNGGHAFLWISKPARHNILSTLRRYRESYHAEHAPVDWYPRGILLDHFFGSDVTPEKFATASYAEQGDFCSEAWQISTEQDDESATVILQRDGFVWTKDASGESIHAPLAVEKQLTLRVDSPTINIQYSLRNTGTEFFDIWWASEWNIAVTGTALPYRHYHADDHTVRHRLDETAQFEAVTNPIVADRWLQLWVEWHFNEPLAMWHVPINTVSRKEGGETEETHQSSAFIFHRRLQLEAQQEYSVQFDVEVTAKYGLQER